MAFRTFIILAIVLIEYIIQTSVIIWKFTVEVFYGIFHHRYNITHSLLVVKGYLPYIIADRKVRPNCFGFKVTSQEYKHSCIQPKATEFSYSSNSLLAFIHPLKEFHALIIYFLNANSVMSGEEKTLDCHAASQLAMTKKDEILNILCSSRNDRGIIA